MPSRAVGIKGKIALPKDGVKLGKKPANGGNSKRPRRAEEYHSSSASEDDDDVAASSDADEDEDEGDSGDDSEGDGASSSSHFQKSKKTMKRKRRAMSPGSFGATMQDLLGDVQEQEGVRPMPLLSKAPHIRRQAESSRLNAKAARMALDARRKRQDRAHVTDVISNWGQPGELPKTLEGEEKQEQVGETAANAYGGPLGYEKHLRKIAQRGVVKLFNAIRVAQNTTKEDLEEEANEAPAKSKGNDNPLGGKQRALTELSKENFFKLLETGAKGKSAA